MAVHQVIDVVSVRDRFMTAARAVNVGLIMAGAVVVRRTFVGIHGRYLNSVVIYMVTVRVM